MTTVILMTLLGVTFQENAALWERVDGLNESMNRPDLAVEELQHLFEEALDIALSEEISSEFEDLRTAAFESDDFTVLDEYVERAGPAIQVISMGESTAIGVNTPCFLLNSPPGTEAYEFFDLASDGFYHRGRIGTAFLPVWMERAGSSAQASRDEELCETYAGIWSGLSSGFTGIFAEVADETITELGGGPWQPEEDELAAYHRVYEDPCVAHVRSALDAYQQGSVTGICQSGGIAEELDKYTEYLSHDFVVLSVNESPMGGRIILLLSCDRPDRIFRAWVYRMGSGAMELREFTESTDFSPAEVQEITDRYRAFLQDRDHTL